MDANAPRDYSDLQRPLEQFRAPAKRLKIHPRELAVLWVVSAQLIILPWWLGSMWPASQWTSLALATLAFGLSLMPRSYTADHTGAASFRLHPWPKLIKFPVFWIGLALLAYFTIQAFNPAWKLETAGPLRWMQKIPHISWLPQGYEAPYLQWNPWRMLVIYTAAWLTVCTIWVAFTRRRTVQLLLIALSVNGIVLSIVGDVQLLTHATKIFGFFASPNPQFFSSFVYKNHGAIYLLIVLAAACGLAGWYYIRGLRRHEKSNPSGVIAFFATVIAVSILISRARGATLVMLVFLLICIAALIVHQVLLPPESRRPIIAIVFILIFGYFLKTGADALRFKEAWSRITSGVAREDDSLEYRERARVVTWAMLQDYWKQGTGAGGFRYFFPNYQYRDPVLVHGNANRRMFWDHAHCDVMQFPIEFGAIGMVLVLAGFLFWTVKLVQNYFWGNPLSACLVLVALLTILSSWWDFPFQNPAILITWCALWPLATLWAQFEESGSKS